MQHQITAPGPLLDEKGHLTEPGYAKTMLPVYDRSAIRAPGWRIKEWDYYYIGNDRYGVALTIADNSYMGLDSISLLDFEKRWEQTTSPMSFFTGGKVGFPSSSSIGDVFHSGKNHALYFRNDGRERVLEFSMKNFCKGKPLEGRICLHDPHGESMVIATPFAGKPDHFYFNQKINCMPAEGSVFFDGREYTFDPADSFAVLDWGRGVWTYRNTWYWGSASGLADGVPFGFNIGYGFGDTSAASENMLFYDHKAHKLEDVTFLIPQDGQGREDYMSPWKFTSSDGRFEMDFVPVLDRHADSNVGIIRSNQHQVFGRFSGKAVLDDGTVIPVKNLMGFAEKVYNKW
ncbi:MAG: DUF2804 domain-containing protein [Emergencia sp.]